MVAAGVDTGGVKNALNRVRDVAWGAGRTFQARHVVLLTSAEVKGMLVPEDTLR